MKEVVLTASKPERLPDGEEPGLNASAVYNNKQPNYPNGCHIVELEIDEQTGETEMVNYCVVDDVGVVMNPLLLKGQILGGISQGVGQMLMEHLRYDPQSGDILSGSFMDYAMPHAKDFSYVHIESHGVPTNTNPLGVKGAAKLAVSGRCRRLPMRLWTHCRPMASAMCPCPQHRNVFGASSRKPNQQTEPQKIGRKEWPISNSFSHAIPMIVIEPLRRKR